MKKIRLAMLVWACCLLPLSAFGLDAAAQLKPIASPAGSVLYGALAGRPTLRAGVGQVLHAVSQRYGDRPQVGRVLRDRSGTLVAVLFRVSAKNEDGRAIAGWVIVAAPPAGQVTAAVLSDDANRFRSTVRPMFQSLRTQVQAGVGRAAATAPGGAPAARTGTASGDSTAAPANTAAAAALRMTTFPDGTGAIGLPPGWTMVNAHGGDVLAKGPKGELLRFGLAISVLDPNNPQSRTLWPGVGRGAPPPGNFVGIPMGTDAATTFVMTTQQLAQKQRRQPPAVNITKVSPLPTPGPGHSYMLEGDVDQHDGKGTLQMVTQVNLSGPMALGGYQENIYEILLPKAAVGEDTAVLPAIFHSYQTNGQAMLAQIHSNMRVNQAITDQALKHGEAMQDATDRQTAAFCDTLLGNSVVRDTQENAHGRTSDDVADLLVKADPNRFEVVQPSDYVKGIDY